MVLELVVKLERFVLVADFGSYTVLLSIDFYQSLRHGINGQREEIIIFKFHICIWTCHVYLRCDTTNWTCGVVRFNRTGTRHFRGVCGGYWSCHSLGWCD